MTTELRTLKDFYLREKYDSKIEGIKKDGNGFLIDTLTERDLLFREIGCNSALNDLKKEAIKWIKSYDIGCGKQWGDTGGFWLKCDGKKHKCTECKESIYHVIPWIKHFFDITDEDLK